MTEEITISPINQGDIALRPGTLPVIAIASIRMSDFTQR